METSELNQKAVLYVLAGRDNYGKATVNAGIEISVRWENKQAEVLDSQGTLVGTDTVVYVDRDVTIGSVLWLGKLINLPSVPTELKEVISYQKIPDVKNRAFRRKLLCMKYSDSLPTIA